ncbi:type I glyceraldehyde-3-phosphate dehydrogenase [Pseudomonadota bacterium]
MKKRIVINGLGRIGANVLRAYFENVGKYSDLEIVAVNAPSGTKVHGYLLKYDSVHGKFPGKIEVKENSFVVNDKEIKVLTERDITKLPWGDLNIDIVMECTGKFRTAEDMQKHLDNGAKKVMLSAPAKGNNVKTFVLGVNDKGLRSSDTMISIGSCTTNCLAPVAKILNDEIGIENGHMTTIHSYTGDQRIVDGSHKDARRGRACAVSMVPTSTGAAKALELVIPELLGRVDGGALRVPTPNVSIVDLTFCPKKETTESEINSLMIKAANGKLKGILEVNSEELVSVDFMHNPHSSIFDLTQTKVIGKNLVRIASWYDNEWGFSNRMLDMAKIW